MGSGVVPRDTTLDAARVQFSILRKIGLKGRANMTFELSDGVRSIVESGIRQRHPDYDAEMVRLAALRASIGERLFLRSYPELELRT